VLIDDAPGDLQELVLGGGMAEQSLGLFDRARLVAHQQAGGHVHRRSVIHVALRFPDDGPRGGELGGTADRDGDLRGQDRRDGLGGLVEGPGAEIEARPPTPPTRSPRLCGRGSST